MNITSIKLINFRNYEKQLITPGTGMNVFYGQNAQGKTNIIEAIYMCCVGRSHRTSRDGDLIRWDQPFSRVDVSSKQKNGGHEVSVIIVRENKKKKNIRINGKHAERIGELFGHVCAVLFSPEDLEIIKGGPGERRRFIDIMLSQLSPRYFYSLQKYMKVLERRNIMLREIPHKPSLSSSLDVWDEMLSEEGAYIAGKRMEAVEKIAVFAEREHRSISSEKENLTLSYRSSIKDYEKAKESLLDLLIRSREEDIRRQVTSYGIHRDDIVIRINGKDARTFGSQGQQRSAVLSMKLSQIDFFDEHSGESPILLMDDVMSELDPYRRRCLSERIDRIQTFVTCTDETDLSGAKQGKLYKVESGMITEE